MTYQVVHRKAAAPAPPPASCCGCEETGRAVETGSPAFRRAVWVVLTLNAAMFVLEVLAGQLAGSMALQADALDFAGDTATYGISLLALGFTAAGRARVALLKGASLAAMGAYVLAASLWRTFVDGAPDAVTMGWVGALALAVNVTAALLLLRFRDGDANVRSVWLCSRNDAIGNLGVLAAAGVVHLTGTKWADLVVASLMAALFVSTSWQVTRQARGELRTIAA
jgi:cation diffusion facilitator family transporter